MKRTRPAFATVLGIVLSLGVGFPAQSAKAAGPAVELDGHRFSIEIADNDAMRERGLMFRRSMPAEHGMLFVFDNAYVQTFWMKNTLIPLDMLFFDSHYKLVSVQQRVPPCRSDPCPVYASTGPAQYVLELNAGTADAIGVKPGDRLTLVQP